eukprot:2691860-Karenia_brevis.AAC.1
MFLLLRQDWKTRLDRLQDHWLRRTLGLGPPIDRVSLLWETGVDLRLSTSTLASVISLLARSELLPTTHLLSKVLAVAETHALTWTRAVLDEMGMLSIPQISDWQSPETAGTREQRAG